MLPLNKLYKLWVGICQAGLFILHNYQTHSRSTNGGLILWTAAFNLKMGKWVLTHFVKFTIQRLTSDGQRRWVGRWRRGHQQGRRGWWRSSWRAPPSTPSPSPWPRPPPRPPPPPQTHLKNSPPLAPLCSHPWVSRSCTGELSCYEIKLFWSSSVHSTPFLSVSDGLPLAPPLVFWRIIILL